MSNIEYGGDEKQFPWDLGVYDSHCHPTDTICSIQSIGSMKTRILTVMATRAQDQALVASLADTHGINARNPADWEDSQRVIPCFGWHPWFSHQMYISSEDDTDIAEKALGDEEKIKHYQSVLQPHRSNPSEEDRRIFLSFPDPKPFSVFLSETRKLLERYPMALVGEVGLDRSFRIPEAWEPELHHERDASLTPGGREGRRLTPFRVDMKHQKAVFKMQLQLAAEFNRGVSVHGVQAHGVVFETLKELYKGHEKRVLSKRERKKLGEDHPSVLQEDEATPNVVKPYPPRVCLHSYSGNAEHFMQYRDPSIPIDIFASFSTAINLSDEEGGVIPRSFEQVIQTVPDHMLLVESDLHTAGDRMDQHMEDIVRRICQVKSWRLDQGVQILAQNWRRFAFGTESS